MIFAVLSFIVAYQAGECGYDDLALIHIILGCAGLYGADKCFDGAISISKSQANANNESTTVVDDSMIENANRSDNATELFLPDEYYENLNKKVQYGYQTPNTREVYRRLGSTSNDIETSIFTSDDFGRIKYRIDYSTHGNDLSHTNPHIHEFVGNTTKGDYHLSEIRYFFDKNTGVMRPGKSNNDGTFRWLD